MMQGLGIRWKLTLWYGLALGVILTLFGGVVYGTMRHHLLSRIDLGLREELTDVQTEVQRAIDQATLLSWLERRFSGHEGFDFLIIDRAGNRFFASNRIKNQNFPIPSKILDFQKPGFETVPMDHSGHWRLIALRVRGPDGPLDVLVGRSLEAFEQESKELLYIFLTTGPLTVLATLACGYFLAYRALAPVQKMNDTARQISTERIRQRIAVANPHDELGRLALTLNEMLDRLAQSFVEMQRFTADAAHELRTPLAVIRNEAEVALRQTRTPAEYEKVLENLLEETVRLSEMAEHLLFLCRQDAGLNSQDCKSVLVGPLLEEIVGNMRLVAEEKSQMLALVPGPTCAISGDERNFRRVFYNLVDNALKYTPSGGEIKISHRAQEGFVTITFADNGVGISEGHLAYIFDRFYRVDASRTGSEAGAGLGLSICKSIVQSYRGSITARSKVGEGTVFEIRFPEVGA